MTDQIGVIGAGQLGRMLALAGYPLGLRFAFLDQSPDAPGAQVGRIVTGAFDDPARIAALASEVDVITFDVENVPVDELVTVGADSVGSQRMSNPTTLSQQWTRK